MEKTMRTGELEVLSPAGNLDIFKAVISAGADAVYFGGELFGARAYADNSPPGRERRRSAMPIDMGRRPI